MLKFRLKNLWVKGFCESGKKSGVFFCSPLFLLLSVCSFFYAGGCNKKTEKAAEEVEEGAKLAAKDSLREGKKVAKEMSRRGKDLAKRSGQGFKKGVRKIGKEAKDLSDKGAEATSGAVDKIKEKAGDVADAGLCKRAYDYLLKCWKKHVEGVSKSKVVGKCSAAMAGGHDQVKQVLYCLRDSKGECEKVKKCVPLPLLKMLTSQ
jgi:hypothetical protein